MGLATFISNVHASGSNIENQNEIPVESEEVESIYLADNKLVYDSGNSIYVSNLETNLDSLSANLDATGHQLIKIQETVADETTSDESIDENEAIEKLNNTVETTDGSEENTQIEDEAQLEELENVEESTPEEESEPEVHITLVDQSEALVTIDNPQEEYTGAIVQLTAEDRYVLEHLVMGEAGNQGYEGAALVAQCIRDTMVYDGIPSVEQVRTQYKYSGSLSLEPNQNVLDACRFIFDEGGIAVKHRIQYFYAPRACDGHWHETQDFVIEHGGHKFFAKW